MARLKTDGKVERHRNLRGIAGSLLGLMLLIGPAMAQIKIGNLYYFLNESDKTVAVTFDRTSGDRYAGDIVIPETVVYDGVTYSVTNIDDMAFSGCTGLTSIEIPNSVTGIDSYAFSGCTGLTSVTIADRETELRFSADVFKDCPIQTLYVGGNINYSPFGGMTTLDTLTIGRSVTEIGYEAFSGCTGLTCVTIANRETELCFERNVFKSCPIRTLYLGGNFSYEYASPFVELITLETLTISGSVTEIGYAAFSGCTALTSIDIPSSVTKIAEHAFSQCEGLISIKIPSSVTEIGYATFNGCTGLTSIDIPSSVTKIAEYAFSYCEGLISIKIPSSVTEIGHATFSGCTALTSIQVDENNANYCSEEGILYDKEKTHLLICPAAKTEVNIPVSVTSIGFSAFEGCTGLISIEIPSSVTSIGQEAFSGCTGLTSIEISNSVTEIGSYAFYGCAGLTTFETGDAVKEIGDCAFQNCGGLLTLTFGKSVSKIGEGIVAGCDKLRRLICTSEEPAACHTNAFQDIHKIRCDLIVPETALEAYKNALVWGDFLRISAGDGSDKVYVERLSLTSPVTPAELKVGEGMLLSAVITPANATNQTLTWSSSDKNVLRVDNDGYVMAVAAGEAVVTARTTDGSNLSATCTVTVTAAGSGGSGDDGGDDGPGSDDDNDKILVETITVSTGGVSTELKAGGTLQLSAVITPSNATNQAVAWSSSDKKVALVDNDGYVVALAAGEAIITARTTDGSDLSATCTLTVTATGTGDEGDDDDILVTALELKPGNTLQLRAVLRSDNATNQTANWSSSDKSVAIIDNDGYVVALAAGETVITARTTDGSDLSATCHIMVVGDTTAVVGLETLKTVRVYAKAGRIEVRGLPLGTAVTLSGVDGRLWYQTEAVTGPELTLSAPRGHVYVLRLNHTHSLKVYLP